jgi:peptidoglycan biosynthesis protein MviN/MurJ (putative lipid II flippase)
MRSAQAFYPMLATGLELSDNTRALPLASFASLVTVIVACVTLVPLFGAHGAALATTSAWLVLGAGYFIIAQRQVRVDHDWVSVGALCACASALVLATVLVQWLPLAARLGSLILLSLVFPMIGMLILRRSETERHRVEILFARLLRRRVPTDTRDRTELKPSV